MQCGHGVGTNVMDWPVEQAQVVKVTEQVVVVGPVGTTGGIVIDVVTGMHWLKSKGNSADENYNQCEGHQAVDFHVHGLA